MTRLGLLILRHKKQVIKYYIITVLVLIVLLNLIPHIHPRIYLHGLFVYNEQSYVKAQNFCSKYKHSMDRDFCRSYITERYIGKKQH